jgi:hypothetical protein
MRCWGVSLRAAPPLSEVMENVYNAMVFFVYDDFMIFLVFYDDFMRRYLV